MTKKMIKVIRNKNGFSLVELLIVIALLGIIAAIGFLTLTGYLTAAVKSWLPECGSYWKSNWGIYVFDGRWRIKAPHK